MTRFKWVAGVGVLAALLGARDAGADAVITSGNGTVTMGVNANGGLFNFNDDPVVGLSLLGLGDALTPGCFCEGWGVAADGSSAYSYAGAGFGIGDVSFVSDAASATVVNTFGALMVTHAYHGSASGAIFQVDVTLENTSLAGMADVRYARNMDWDIPPTEFAEFVTIQRGGATALLHSSDDGFASSDPLLPAAGICAAPNTDYDDNGPCDHGAWFSFGFGPLAAAASTTFQIFYGATSDEASALTALGAVGAEVYSLGQSSGGEVTGEPGTYIFGFAGVGGTPVGPDPDPDPGSVPEPSMTALAALSLLGAASRRLTRKA